MDGELRYADTPTIEATTWIAAPPERVWEFASDPLLIPTLSPELQAVEWLDGATTATSGARFRGHNRHEVAGEWSTVCTIVECEAPRVFTWVVEDLDNPTATWRFTLAADGDGTQLTQWARMGPGPSGLTPAIRKWPERESRIVQRRLDEWERGMQANLAGIKELAETG